MVQRRSCASSATATFPECERPRIRLGAPATTYMPRSRAARAASSIVEFPTTLEAARAARDLGMYVVAGAPNLIRGRSHSGNVAVAELAQERLCTILSSDYCPSSLLQGVFELARNFKFSLPA